MTWNSFVQDSNLSCSTKTILNHSCSIHIELLYIWIMTYIRVGLGFFCFCFYRLSFAYHQIGNFSALSLKPEGGCMRSPSRKCVTRTSCTKWHRGHFHVIALHTCCTWCLATSCQHITNISFTSFFSFSFYFFLFLILSQWITTILQSLFYIYIYIYYHGWCW